jgi:hypothetical protein
MKTKRLVVVCGALLGAAGLAVGGAVALGWHRTPAREVELGALATPVTTDPTATDDPVVSSVLVNTVYPTVASLGAVTTDGPGYVVRLRGDAPVSADQVAKSLSHSHESGSPLVKASLADVDKVSTVDAHTVRITLSHPDANLPQALAGAAGAVVVPGSGRYRIDSFAPGRSLTLTRVRGSGPAKVRWHFYGDAESLRADLGGGRLDLVAPAVDIKLPDGARKVDGPTGPAIVLAVNPSHKNDQKLVDAVKAASASAAPAAVALPEKSSGQPPLVLRTTNEPYVVAAAQAARRQLAGAGIAVTVFASPPDQWRQLVDAGSYDLAVGTGLPGDQIGTVHYAMVLTSRIVGVPKLTDGGGVDLSTLRVR